jgi:hypothetical protein
MMPTTTCVHSRRGSRSSTLVELLLNWNTARMFMFVFMEQPRVCLAHNLDFFFVTASLTKDQMPPLEISLHIYAGWGTIELAASYLRSL